MKPSGNEDLEPGCAMGGKALRKKNICGVKRHGRPTSRMDRAEVQMGVQMEMAAQ